MFNLVMLTNRVTLHNLPKYMAVTVKMCTAKDFVRNFVFAIWNLRPKTHSTVYTHYLTHTFVH